MTAPAISDAVRIYSELRERLLSDFPDLDEQTLLDTLEGETDLNERIVSLCRAANETAVLSSALSDMLDTMRQRIARFDKRAQHLRDIALWAMQEAGIPKITAPDMTLTISKGRSSVVITDETIIPQDYISTRIVKTPVKTAIKEAIERGIDVPGATLSNSPNFVQIRTK